MGYYVSQHPTDSHVHLSSQSAGGAAEAAATRKNTKYADLPASCIFQPLAFETHGATHSPALDFVMSEQNCLFAAVRAVVGLSHCR